MGWGWVRGGLLDDNAGSRHYNLQRHFALLTLPARLSRRRRFGRQAVPLRSAYGQYARAISEGAPTRSASRGEKSNAPPQIRPLAWAHATAGVQFGLAPVGTGVDALDGDVFAAAGQGAGSRKVAQFLAECEGAFRAGANWRYAARESTGCGRCGDCRSLVGASAELGTGASRNADGEMLGGLSGKQLRRSLWGVLARNWISLAGRRRARRECCP